MKKRSILGIVAVMVFALVSAGCSGPTQSGSAGATSTGELTGKISFLEKWPDPKYKVYFDKVVADYVAAHPGVEIDHQAWAISRSRTSSVC